MTTMTFAEPAAPTTHPVDQLLRDRSAFLDRIEDRSEQLIVARAMIATIIAGTAVFGASMGTFRMNGPYASSLQVLFGAVKLPLIVLLTASVAAPAVSALSRALRGQSDLRRDFTLVLSSLALVAMILAAVAPVVLLMVLGGASYHLMILAVVGCCAVAGAFGLAFFTQGLRRIDGPGRWTILLAGLTVFAMVGTQMAWTTRPYLARPRTENVPFIRAVEDSFIDAVRRSFRSARGIYVRPEAPLPEHSSLQPHERSERCVAQS